MPKAHIAKYAFVLTALIVLLTGCQPRVEIVPAPQFSVYPGEGQVPLRVQFQDASIPGVSPIQAWWWDFGDGATSTSRNPQHIYREAGLYHVQLVITTSEGNFSLVKENAVRVRASGSFGEPDDTNTFSAEGITIQLPQGYDRDISFGIVRDRARISLDAYTPLDVLSDTYTVLHSQANPDLFVYGAGGGIAPTTVSVQLLDPLPATVGPLNLAQLMVRLGDGRTVPIPGSVVDNTFVAQVLRLPQQADYVVVRRANATLTDVRTVSPLYEERLESSDNDDWDDYFSIYACTLTEQIITALYRGSMDDEASFQRRNYPMPVVEDVIFRFAELAQEALNDLAASGLRAPVLVPRDGGYTLSLFKMHPSYSLDIERATDVIYYDNFFGHLVVDPAQLTAVTIRNLRIAAVGPDAVDYREPFYPHSAFAEALFQSVIPRYAIPAITTSGNTALGLPIPADRTGSGAVKPVSFIQGLQDGAALYIGRRSLNYKGRNFGENENGLLSSPALFPYSPVVPGYSYAAHEFFAWLDELDAVNNPLSVLAETLGGVRGELDAIGSLYNRPLNFREAQTALYRALDKAIQQDVAGTLAEFYWEFVKDYAYVNGEDSILRPSDALRPPYSFNEDRFEDDAVITVSVNESNAILDLTPANTNGLKDIAPMTARAIVLELHPLTTEIELFIDTSICELEGGYVPNVAVYQDGQVGVELSDPQGDMRNYTLLDTSGDGRTDTIRVWELGCEGAPCANRVIVLVANLQFDRPCDLSFNVSAFTSLDIPEEDVLSRYVHAYEPLYDYELDRVLNYSASDGYVAYVLNMTSGAWRGAHEVYVPLWQHDLIIIEPTNISRNTAMLFVSGGSRGLKNFTSTEMRTVEELADLAKVSRTAIALLTLVPNQPLAFTDEFRLRSEDAILAYSFNKYMQALDFGFSDMTWPALLPMTRAAVRAMDTVQDFMANKPGRVRNIDNFVVAGASKRGWTTWLTAASDNRVKAIIPMVIDVLNMPAQMEHHRNAYASYPFNSPVNRIFNGYSTAIRDYVELDVFGRFGDPAGQSLLKIVDPYRYRNVLTMPKLIANSTGDQFFLPDSSRFYLANLFGDNYVHYAPNTDHSLTDGLDLDNDTLSAIRSFYIAQVVDAPIPAYSWTYNQATTEIVVTTGQAPLEVLYWEANSPVHRDFRQQTLGNAWDSTELEADFDGAYRAVIGTPGSGFRAGYIQIRFEGPVLGNDFVFSTPVYVTPDMYLVAE